MFSCTAPAWVRPAIAAPLPLSYSCIHCSILITDAHHDKAPSCLKCWVRRRWSVRDAILALFA